MNFFKPPPDDNLEGTDKDGALLNELVSIGV